MGRYLPREHSPLFSVGSKNEKPYLGSREWANDLLHQGIELLKEGAKSEGYWLWNQRLAAVLCFKKELLDSGFTWQANRIDNWIHRLAPRRGDPEREAGRAPK